MITIRFCSSDPDLKVCTSHQRRTYQFLRERLGPGQRLKVKQVLEALGLTSTAPLVSRLNHLQEKGLITWVRVTKTREVTA